MTTQPSDWAVAPKFGEWLRGIYASERNPLRDGMYVRTIRRTGRCNPGTYYELTDGKGNFWQYPRESVIRLDRARELDASGGASPLSDIIASMRNFADVADEVTVNNAPTAIRNWADMLEASGGGQTTIDLRRFRPAVEEWREGVEWLTWANCGESAIEAQRQVDEADALLAIIDTTARPAEAATTNSVQISSEVVVGDAVDAARYRWLKAQNAITETPDEWTITRCDFTDEEEPIRYWVGDDLDAAIDAAMGAVGAGGGE